MESENSRKASMKKDTVINVVAVLMSFVLVSGCASTKNSLAEAEAPTMKEIYHAHMNGTHGPQITDAKIVVDETEPHQANEDTNAKKSKSDEHIGRAGDGLNVHRQSVVHTSMHEHPSLPKSLKNLQRTFAPLPNPVLLMYIPAHLTSGGTPVPGYSTYFSLYEREHIALPSERRSLE